MSCHNYLLQFGYFESRPVGLKNLLKVVYIFLLSSFFVVVIVVLAIYLLGLFPLIVTHILDSDDRIPAV